MAMTKSEQFVAESLHKRFGVTLEKIAESPGKSPDFIISAGGRAICSAELKAIEHFPATSERGWRMPNPESGEPNSWASRDDNAVSRVASKIHRAFEQLSRYPRPYALIFLNWDPLVDVKDLEEAYTGEHIYGNANFAYVNTVSKKIAEGKIKHEKDKIDLYIWIEGREEKDLFRYPTQHGHDLAHTYFPCAAGQASRG